MATASREVLVARQGYLKKHLRARGLGTWHDVDKSFLEVLSRLDWGRSLKLLTARDACFPHGTNSALKVDRGV